MVPKKFTSDAWYQLSVEKTLDQLESNKDTGLSKEEAAKRISQIGKNVLHEAVRQTMIDQIIGQLRSPLVFILLCAGIVTTLLGEYVDATVIFIALMLNIAISLYQEGRADKAFLRLRNSQEKFATVLRGGNKERISADGLTIGDIAVLETGMNIPADIRIIESINIEVNESPLTGEWIDVAKRTEPYDTLTPYAEQRNMGFMGSLISAGSGLGVVVSVGDATKIGAIASALQEKRNQKTPLQENISRISGFLTKIILVSLVGISILGFIHGESITEILLVSIAIAVAAIPEGLPAAVTVVLALGMEAVLARGGLVRNLLAAETLGSTTVILTDKTGTLTKAQMVVSRVVTLGTMLAQKGKSEEYKIHEAHGDERDVLQFASLCSDAFIEKTAFSTDALADHVVRGRPVERAIVLSALESGLNQTELLVNYPRIDFLPFESKHRVAVSLHHIRGMKHNRIYMTGAPEYLIENSHEVYLEGNGVAMTPDIKLKLEDTLKHFTNDGYRLIGVAYSNTTLDAFSKNGIVSRDTIMSELIFAGFIVLQDPLRDDVTESIRLAKRAGARVIMATGDNLETGRTIAKECGIWHEGDVALVGSDISAMSDEELGKALKSTTVFARMLPEHKLRLVRLLRASGEVVAMTGDGVNDAPALRFADIGVALGSGTEVAKEASDLILLNNSFSIIVSAIEEGRRIVDNLRKIVAYLLSTSFSEIIVVAGSLLVGIPLPILPAQILWTNMLSEGFMNFAFAFEPKEDDLMLRNPKVTGARTMLSKSFIHFIIIVGISSGTILLAYYAYLLEIADTPLVEARTLIFIMLTVAMTLSAFSLKDLRRPIYRIKLWSNRFLLGSFAFSIFGLFVAIKVEFLRTILRLSDAPLLHAIPMMFVFIAINIFAVEIVKYFLFERRIHRVVT
ncbi:MAG: ATPase [Parcubacteria group bacterium GW2011_GWA2_47_7]|nr:MAG: ATPase [Parcubacteria group bacterium GW2011_GWA2_47_7]